MSGAMTAVLVVALARDALALLPDSIIQETLKGIPEDGLLDTVGIAKKYGCRCEEYTVTTEDGYMLTVFNIRDEAREGARHHLCPVLLNHGVFDTSDGFMLVGERSLALTLARRGHDVWLINFRGNRYSRRHATLDPDRNATFWEYSAHEYGHYDLPAAVDHVLAATGRDKLCIVAFSEGTTAAFIMGATRPAYNDKVEALVAMAPVAGLKHTEGPLTFLIRAGPFLDLVVPGGEIAGWASVAKALINLLCTQLVIGYDLCYGAATNPLVGPNFGIDNATFHKVIGHFPAGTSKKNLIHFSQMGLREFAQYDYGLMKNLEVYRSFGPPAYELSRVRMATYLLCGGADRVSTLRDAAGLRSALGAAARGWRVTPHYNHLDHLWARDAHLREYEYIAAVLQDHSAPSAGATVRDHIHHDNTTAIL